MPSRPLGGGTGSAVDIPESVTDLLEADLELSQLVTHVDTPVPPANPAVATDAGALEVAGVDKRTSVARYGRGDGS